MVSLLKRISSHEQCKRYSLFFRSLRSSKFTAKERSRYVDVSSVINASPFREGFRVVNLISCCNLSGVCNASVIFGIGKQKYRTEAVRDNDPTWNEETTM